MVPISGLRICQNELLEEASEKPIVLAEHGKPVAVLLGPDSYHRLIEQLEDLQLALDAVDAQGEDAPDSRFEEQLKGRGEDL